MNVDVPEHLIEYAQEWKSMLREPASIHDLSRVKDRVRDFDRNIAQIQTDIAKHKAAIALLEAKRDWMERCVQSGRSLLAPIRRIPPEILYRVFSICCEGGTLLDVYGATREDVPMPVRLSMVCSIWRDMAFSSGTFWSDMRFNFQGSEQSEVGSAIQRCLRITETFLKCAGSTLLSLSFDRPYHVEITDSVEPILHTLCRRAGQWGSVTFNTLPSAFVLRSAFEAITGNLSNLHTIKVVEDSVDGPFTFGFLGSCPALRAAEIDIHIERPSGPQTLPAFWAQITSLSLYLHSDAAAPSQILPLCSNLSTLELSLHGSYAGEDLNTVMPTLRSLTVTYVRSRSPVFPDFFRLFTFPLLISFDLRSDSFLNIKLGVDDMASLAGFIQRLPPSLATLSLSCSCLTGAQAFRLLQYLPHLTFVHLSEVFFYFDQKDMCTPCVFDYLQAARASRSSSDPSDPLLPRLLHLKISIVNRNSLTHEYFEQLVETIRSRWIPDPEQATALGVDCLRSVEVQFLGRDKPPTLPRALGELEVLRDEGLRVILPMLPLAEEEQEQANRLQPAVNIFGAPPESEGASGAFGTLPSSE
ncbi:hypothetical protein V5O48_014555 [Marasmius crinis-equi]|uniref:F-box domain-containing protein n=1 Tax=Marasmius crinis-equi TaxID=585013 RepID=A0ABR3EWZ5_9AGAR